MSRNLEELQQTLQEKEAKLDKLYQEEKQVLEEDEYEPEAHSFVGWFKLMLSGLKHPNDYYDEEDEEDDTD